MKSFTSNFDAKIFAQEFFTALLMAVILLVTGCAESGNHMRTALAPPPPFITAASYKQDLLSPEIIALRSIQTIEPAAGDEQIVVEKALGFKPKCRNVGFSETSSFGVDFGDSHKSKASQLSFDALHASSDAASMTLRFNLAMPGETAPACR